MYTYKHIQFDVFEQPDGSYISLGLGLAGIMAQANNPLDCFKITKSRIDRSIPSTFEAINKATIQIPTTSKREHENALKEDGATMGLTMDISSITVTKSISHGDSLDDVFHSVFD